MRVLLTGATGFVGEHLVRLLASNKATIYGTYLLEPSPLSAVLLRCDLRNDQQVRAVVREARPERVFHLAAISKPSESLKHFKEVYDTNFWGTYNLLESLRELVPKARVLVVGTGQCYGGLQSKTMPITEDWAFAPPNPYALSKAAADMLAGQYHSRFGMHIIRARPFNHTGPGQPRGFVCSDYAHRVAEIELGRQEPVVSVRDARVERDFSDVRDVVRAYDLLLKKGVPGQAYNVASGYSISVRDIVRLLAAQCTRRLRISEVRERVRAENISCLRADNRKLRRATEWKPAYNMRQTLVDLLEFWRETLGK
jgi:GDP-4-dehydro-6-deoxy-D-mannose reductase